MVDGIGVLLLSSADATSPGRGASQWFSSTPREPARTLFLRLAGRGWTEGRRSLRCWAGVTLRSQMLAGDLLQLLTSVWPGLAKTGVAGAGAYPARHPAFLHAKTTPWPLAPFWPPKLALGDPGLRPMSPTRPKRGPGVYGEAAFYLHSFPSARLLLCHRFTSMTLTENLKELETSISSSHSNG
jgi:hypothetical protein